MLFQREAKRLLLSFLVMFAFIALAASYWAINGQTTLLKREDNPRLVEAEAAVRRGSILDRNGVPLVISVPLNNTINGAMIRRYENPAMVSALGYYSLRYGVNGVEAAYDDLLSGRIPTADLNTAFFNDLLERPRTGTDIMVTLDTAIQERLAERMAGNIGAGIVIAVPSGQILGLVSLPTYDPNQLDAQWDALIATPGDPFFNRVLQGRYQPGGALQTPLMAAASLVDIPFDVPHENATLPLEIDGISLSCAVPLAPQALNLSEAYAYACPRPFSALAEQLGETLIDDIFDTFRLTQYPTLPGFTALATPISPTPTSTPMRSVSDPNVFEAAALGQGEIVVSPLMMALITAGIANDGNAPQPQLLYATRALGSDDQATWIYPIANTLSVPITTETTARRLQDLMRNTLVTGAAQNAARAGFDIGGHASLAYSGEETHTWFIGFVTLTGPQSIVIVIVLEQNADTQIAADIAGDVLTIAHDRLSR